MNVFGKTREILATRGFAALAVENARHTDPITLHAALRRACGLEPTAWLPAYKGWEHSTAVYVSAYTVLSDLVAQRHGGPLDLSVWSGRVGENRVVDLLTTAEAAKPGMSVGEPPELRRGCRASMPGTLSISGVLIAAIKQLAELRRDLDVGAIIGQAATSADVDLRSVGNEDFLRCLLAADPTGGAGVGAHRLDAEAENALLALQRAAKKRADYRVPRLVATIAGLANKPVVALTNTELGSLCRLASDPKTGTSFLPGGGTAPGEIGSASPMFEKDAITD
jgi:hypothetical protein